ncbi:MAG TPA: asparaginase domain-containing protein [Aquirhabdus sp.]
MPNSNNTPQFGVLYLGGTIGCAGQPLAPLSAEVFLPQLAALIESELVTTLGLSQWHYFSGNIKDSSALVPADWGDILELLLNPMYAHIQHWIILHGTDTLAFTAAFLAEALRGTPLKVVVTGSQLPLLDPIKQTFTSSSDAFNNIKTAYSAFSDATLPQEGWVRVAFNQQHWTANSVQKIHSTEYAAFTGQQNEPNQQIAPKLSSLAPHSSRLKEALQRLNIQIYYASPLPLNVLIAQLEQILMSDADAVILMAYGLGNFPDDLRIHRALLAAEQRGVMVILTTQVPFGGIESRYAAGDWLAACGVLSGGALPLPALFARLAWILVIEKTYTERRQLWLEYNTVQ